MTEPLLLAIAVLNLIIVGRMPSSKPQVNVNTRLGPGPALDTELGSIVRVDVDNSRITAVTADGAKYIGDSSWLHHADGRSVDTPALIAKRASWLQAMNRRYWMADD